jgi:hypothetical protein
MTKEEKKEYDKKYRLNNKEKIKERHKKWLLNNKEEIKEQQKQWRLENKEAKKEYDKQYRLNNKEEIKERNKKWNLANKEEQKEYDKKYQRNRYQTDPLYKLICIARSRICKFIKSSGLKKTSKTFDIVGCTPEYLRQHLQKQFVDGMNWSNQGEWHIDHIIPLASATNEEGLIKLFHYTNLQPLWARDNMIKGDKIL